MDPWGVYPGLTVLNQKTQKLCNFVQIVHKCHVLTVAHDSRTGYSWGHIFDIVQAYNYEQSRVEV